MKILKPNKTKIDKGIKNNGFLMVILYHFGWHPICLIPVIYLWLDPGIKSWWNSSGICQLQIPGGVYREEGGLSKKPSPSTTQIWTRKIKGERKKRNREKGMDTIVKIRKVLAKLQTYLNWEGGGERWQRNPVFVLPLDLNLITAL